MTSRGAARVAFMLIGTTVFMTIFGFAMGLNVGTALSDTHGARGACELLRFQIYDCDSFGLEAARQKEERDDQS